VHSPEFLPKANSFFPLFLPTNNFFNSFFFWFYLFIFFLFNFFSFSKTKNRGDATTLIGWLFLSTLICKWYLKVLIYISTCGDYNSISIFFFFKFLLVSRVEASINGYLHCNSWFFLCVLFLLCSFEVE